MSSALDTPTISMFFGLLPLTARKSSGGLSFKLNLFATLRPEAISSQQCSLP